MKRALTRFRWSRVVLLGSFVLSRAAVEVAGVRFDATPLNTYYQFADPVLLENDLGRTIWWMHMQPPLLNLLAGIGLHLPAAARVWVYAFVFLVFGVVLMFGVYTLCEQFRLPPWLGVVLAIVVGCSPSALVYENLLFYPNLVATALVVSFVGLIRYLRTGSVAWGLISFVAAAVLVLTRATYHPVWLSGLVLVALLARPELRRKTLLVAMIPLVLGWGLYIKNWDQFGTFAGSSWVGLNLANMPRLTAKDPTAVKGILAIPSFSPLSAHVDLASRAPTGIPILDETTKSSGQPNFNNLSYVDLSNRYLRASATFIRHNPAVYREGVTNSLAYEFSPATAQPTARGAATHLGTYVRAFDGTVGGQRNQYAYFAPGTNIPVPPTMGEISWTYVLVYALALGMLPAVAWRARYRPGGDDVARWVLAAVSGTIWLGVLSSVLLETTENSRFRHETDAIAWVLAAVLIAGFVRRVASWRSRRTMARADDIVIDLRDVDRPVAVLEPQVHAIIVRP